MSPVRHWAWLLWRRLGVRMPAPVPPTPPQQIVRTYTGWKRQRAFQREAARLLRQGYTVASQSDSPQVPGLLRQRQPATLTVVYQRKDS